MLTSAGRAEEAARCRQIGVDAYLIKPVKHSDLLDTLATLFGGSAAPTVPARAAEGRTGFRPLHILVAEDNAVNRKLVTKLLEKRGHRVTGVENGREAVAAADGKARFDLVLMDLQMPEMGGFEATESIRRSEARTGAHLPIVALTAHAMQGDRERCLAAGMDAYLPKPIDVDELLATVERIGGGAAAVAPGRAPRRPAAASEAIFDQQSALAHTGGDRRLLKEVIALFRADAPSYVRRIDRALKQKDGEALRTAAHGLKGAIATVGSPAGRQAAADLEHAGRASDFDAAAAAYAHLLDRMKQLDAALTAADFSRTPARRKARRPSGKRKRS
jgi:CheY-like chemotaxis protein